MTLNRRQFLQTAAAVGIGAGAGVLGAPAIAQSRTKVKVGYLHTLAVDGQIWTPEIYRPLVSEEDVAVSNEQLVDANDRLFGSRIITCRLRARKRSTEPVGLEEWLEPFESPLQRTHNAILIARGQPGFPLIHPARVLFPEHVPGL